MRLPILPTIFRKKAADQRDKAVLDSTDPPNDGETGRLSRMGSESLILVMGVTGAGKSYFINQLKPNSVTEGHSIVSRQQRRMYGMLLFANEK